MGRGASSLKKRKRSVFEESRTALLGLRVLEGHWEWCRIDMKYNRSIGMEDQWIVRPEGTEKGAKTCVFPGTETPALPWPPHLLPTEEKMALFTTLHYPPCLSSPAHWQPLSCFSPANAHGLPMTCCTPGESPHPPTGTAFHYSTSSFLLQWDSPSDIWVHLLFMCATLLWTKCI